MGLIWYTVLIRSVPELMGEILITLALAKKKFRKRDLLLASIISGLGTFLIRMLSFKFGIHTLVAMIFQTAVICIIPKVDIYRAFSGVLISMFVIGLSESATMAFMEFVLGIDMQILYSNAIITLAASIPSLIMLYLTAFIIFKINNKKIVRRKLCNNEEPQPKN